MVVELLTKSDTGGVILWKTGVSWMELGFLQLFLDLFAYFEAYWLKWLKCFSPAHKNMFVDPDRSTVFDLVLNFWVSLEMPMLLDKSCKVSGVHLTNTT